MLCMGSDRLKFDYIKNDFKQLIREPMMLMLFIAPLLIFILFKLILILVVPFALTSVNFEFEKYFIYILAFVFVLTPGMLGIVTGFMMLDERDGKIAELMAVTPLGRSGYLFNRLSFAFVATLIYTFIGYYFVDIYEIPIYSLFLIAVLLGLFSSCIGILIFTISSDKVKGLTYAKGLNLVMLFCLADLLNEKWVTYLAMIFPTYWITEMLQHPKSLKVFCMALLVHGFWFCLLLWNDHERSQG